MAVTFRKRLVAVAGISAVALLGMATAGAAQPDHTHARPEPGDVTAATRQPSPATPGDLATQDRQLKPDKPLQKPGKPARPATQAKRDRKVQHDRKADVARQAPQAQRAADQNAQPRAPRQEQDLRVRQQEQRLAQYREYLAQQQQQIARQQAVQGRYQNRVAQQRSQQQYAARLRQQQLQIERRGRFDYYGDPYVSTPWMYRYARSGRYYETNQYGIDLLRQAVNYGYEEGYRAGAADRADRWRGGYDDSYAYQDASYGYSGLYVDRNDYTDYFREGFRRGYDDGFHAQSRYGRFANDRGSILGGVLSIILKVEVIR